MEAWAKCHDFQRERGTMGKEVEFGNKWKNMGSGKSV
jgi:hypothetical protein